MKKLVSILALFAILMTGAVVELVYSTRFYATTYEKLTALEDVIVVSGEQINTPETLQKLVEVEKHWRDGRKLALVLGNHAVIRNADEKMVAMAEFLRLNEVADTRVSLKQALSYISDLITDTHPNLTNLF